MSQVIKVGANSTMSDLQPDAVLEAASRATGLTDDGDLSFVEGLRAARRTRRAGQLGDAVAPAQTRWMVERRSLDSTWGRAAADLGSGKRVQNSAALWNSAR